MRLWETYKYCYHLASAVFNHLLEVSGPPDFSSPTRLVRAGLDTKFLPDQNIFRFKSFKKNARLSQQIDLAPRQISVQWLDAWHTCVSCSWFGFVNSMKNVRWSGLQNKMYIWDIWRVDLNDSSGPPLKRNDTNSYRKSHCFGLRTSNSGGYYKKGNKLSTTKPDRTQPD